MQLVLIFKLSIYLHVPSGACTRIVPVWHCFSTSLRIAFIFPLSGRIYLARFPLRPVRFACVILFVMFEKWSIREKWMVLVGRNKTMIDLCGVQFTSVSVGKQ